MAGDDDEQRVGGTSSGRGACGGRLAAIIGESGVADSDAVGDGEELMPDGLLEVGGVESYREIETEACAVEILVELGAGCIEDRE